MPKARQAAPHDLWLSANLYILAFFLWLGLIVIMNTAPADSLPDAGIFSQVPHFDKFVHFVQYTILTFLLIGTINSIMAKIQAKSYPIALLAFPYIFAVVDELMQYPVAGRQTDPLDVLADWSGATTVIILATLKKRFHRQR